MITLLDQLNRVFVSIRLHPAIVFIALLASLMMLGCARADSIDTEILIQKASAGDPVAQDQIALHYSRLQEHRQAIDWWKKAAQQGHAPAQVNLGLMYQAGIGVSPDLDTARRWYLAAALQHDSDAQNNLALLLRHAEGSERHTRQALIWFERAAAQGSGGAMNSLGEMHDAGEGISKNRQKALSWWRRAAINGHAGGWVHLADAYARGDGVPMDSAMAYAMLERARQTGPSGHAVEWYERIDSQINALPLGLSWEDSQWLENTGKVAAALTDPPAE